MGNRPEKHLAEHTPHLYEGYYPPYVNITQVGSMVRVTVRGVTKDDGSCGDTAIIECNVWNLNEIAKAFKKAAENFDTNVELVTDTN